MPPETTTNPTVPMPIVNLTALTIRLCNDQGEVYQTFEPDEQQLTVRTQGEEHEVDGVPVEITRITGVDALPEPHDGTFYIVPQPVAYTSDRTDLVIPDTGPTAVRQDDGTVYAVRRLYTVVGDGR